MCNNIVSPRTLDNKLGLNVRVLNGFLYRIVYKTRNIYCPEHCVGTRPVYTRSPLPGSSLRISITVRPTPLYSLTGFTAIKYPYSIDTRYKIFITKSSPARRLLSVRPDATVAVCKTFIAFYSVFSAPLSFSFVILLVFY